MTTHKTDVAAEYLREVDLRLSGLPLLQRRELLADLEAHIDEARRTARSEGELIEVLERLGSPEVVAAAAYEEAGTTPAPVVQPPLRRMQPWLIAVVVVVAVLLLCGVFGAFFVGGASVSEAPLPAPTQTAPPAPTAPR